MRVKVNPLWIHILDLNVSCPVFGGKDGSELRATTALEHLDSAARANQPDGGKVFKASTSFRGQVEAMYRL